MTPPHLPLALQWLADARAAWEAAPTPEALDRYRRAMAGVLFLQGLASTDHRRGQAPDLLTTTTERTA